MNHLNKKEEYNKIYMNKNREVNMVVIYMVNKHWIYFYLIIISNSSFNLVNFIMMVINNIFGINLYYHKSFLYLVPLIINSFIIIKLLISNFIIHISIFINSLTLHIHINYQHSKIYSNSLSHLLSIIVFYIIIYI